MKEKGTLKLESLTYIGFALIVFRYTWSTKVNEIPIEFARLLMAIATVLFLLHIFFKKLSLNEFILLIILVCLGVANYINTGYEQFLLLILCAFSLKGTDINNLLKIFVSITLLFLVSTILESIITNENIYNYAQYRAAVGYEKRYTLGFKHPNGLHSCFFRIVCGTTLLSDSLNKKPVLFLLEILNILLYFLSKSRTGFIAVSFLILFVLFKETFSKILGNKRFIYIANFVYIFFVYIMIFLVVNYGKYNYIYIINTLLTGRIYLANRFYREYSFSLFGRNIDQLLEVTVLDSGIINSLISYGIVCFVVIIICYYKGMHKLWVMKKYLSIIVILTIMLYSISENIMVNIFLNPALLISIYYLFPSNMSNTAKNQIYDNRYSTNSANLD